MAAVSGDGQRHIFHIEASGPAWAGLISFSMEEPYHRLDRSQQAHR